VQIYPRTWKKEKRTFPQISLPKDLAGSRNNTSGNLPQDLAERRHNTCGNQPSDLAER